MEKQCRRCEKTKHVSLMKADHRYGDGYSSFCKDCHKAASIAWQKANPAKVNEARKKRYALNREKINEARKGRYDLEKARLHHLPYRYGMTVAQYDELLASQGGCAVCGKQQSEFKRRFSVDHDHSCCSGARSCGKCVRGILCHPCNVAIHAVDTNPGWAFKAEKYLIRSKRDD